MHVPIGATGLAFGCLSLSSTLSSPRFRRMPVALPFQRLWLCLTLVLHLKPSDTCVLWCFSDVLQDSIVTGAWLPDDSKLSRLDPAVESELALFTQNWASPVYVSFSGVAAVSRKMLGCVVLALQRLKFSAILDGLLSRFVSSTCRVARMMHRVCIVQVANQVSNRPQ